MSFFQKSKIDLKKHYIITSSASACAVSATLPLCFGMWFFSNKRLWALCCGLHIREWEFKRWSESWGGYFDGFLVGHFWGMFWNSISVRGEIDTPVTSVRWSSIECRKRSRESWGGCFAGFLVGCFWGMFWILSGPPKKHYSTLEFKVIGIVYIVGVG